MKFSSDGPEIPNELIDAASRGDIVFLCGAGISQSSGLPNFRELTKKVFEKLSLDMTAAEQHSFEKDRYEETLGSLSRRLADKRSLYIAVAEELSADETANISSHATILKLSRDFEGRPAVITTNFDTLFERSLREQSNSVVRDKSFAGAQIPAPAGPRFEGVIHLHGRLADENLDLEESDLVLTSADYGDAYLRSGWAARFLYDLARTRTIVLVGYSASDAPVRYILNILEADRERFPDLNDIFVLADTKGLGIDAAEAEWDAIAVEPILFDAPEKNFEPFWSDMGEWANLAELPRQWRRHRLEELVTKPFEHAQDWERQQTAWILGHEDAIDLIDELNFSPEWIEFSRSQNIFKPESQSEWSLAKWAEKRLSDLQVFQQMLNSIEVLGPPAASIIERALDHEEHDSIPSYLEKAWRLLIIALRQPPTIAHWSHFAAFKRVKDRSASRHDLREIVRLYTPRLKVSKPYSFYDWDEEIASIGSICRVEFDCNHYPTFDEFLQIIPVESVDLMTVLQLATCSLIDSLQLAYDAEFVGPYYDSTSHSVPSIENHVQNEHKTGFLPLVRLCAELWLKLRELDVVKAYMISECWEHAGFALTKRLWLFSLQNDPDISSDIVADKLIALGTGDFWGHRKEIMELLRDRVSQTSQDKLDIIVRRILDGPEFDDDLDAEDRKRYSDISSWLYLQALDTGKASLSDPDKSAFEEIKSRRNWKDRNLEESDFFWSWFSSSSGPTGDPEPIAEAETETRVELAAELEKRDPLNQSDAWRIYCDQDPESALESLIVKQRVSENVSRWRELISAIRGIGDIDDKAKARGLEMCVNTFEFITQQNKNDLGELAHSLVNLYEYALKIDAPVDEELWGFLWECSLHDDVDVPAFQPHENPGYELISKAINSASGELSRLMINRFGPRWVELTKQEQERTENRISSMISSQSVAGMLARAIIVEFVAWLHTSLPDLLDPLLEHMIKKDKEGEALRSIFVGLSRSVNAEVRAKMKRPLLDGVSEHHGNNQMTANVASQLVGYVFDDLHRQNDDPQRLGAGEAKATLTNSNAEVMAATADILANWLNNEQERPKDELWNDEYSKIFIQIWPADKRLQTNLAAVPLAKLAVATGNAFSDCLDVLAPYIVPLDEDWPSLYFATTDQANAVVDAFPHEMLNLLWLLLKPASRGRSDGLGKVLEQIAKADESLVRDRRFQLLETRVLRYKSDSAAQ